MTPHWEHFEHQADIGVRGYGNSIEQAFEQAALAMMAIMTDISLINAQQKVNISCADHDPALLLTDWLNALIFEIATHKLLFCEFDVAISDGQLTATARGETIDVAKHQPAVEIKGATFTELAVKQVNDQWMAQCVVDV
ncbi:MAG: archease [Gammaproteobacteria bacterium]|nr:archease [Gammaproteobacteria bacterium]MDH5736253.1 archease [Gammaproteobacteria bacterium]